MTRTASHRLRQAIRQIQRQRNPKRRRYGVALRRAVVEHAVAEQSRGASVRSIAASVGIPYKTLYIWLRSRPRGFRAVATKPAETPATSTDLLLVTARGHRVEGLSRDDLVALLRALS